MNAFTRKFAWVYLCAFFIGADAFAATADVASRLFNRIAGYSLSLANPRRAQMESLISQGKLLEAARIASAEDGFYNITVRQFAAPMSNREESARVVLNDFIAMFVGVTRDNRDARELLSGNFLYIGNSNDPAYKAACTDRFGNYDGNCVYTPSPAFDSPLSNLHYQAIDKMNLAKYLIRISPQRPDLKDAAGVLTSTAWANAHFAAGTNRRATEYALREFLCSPIQDLQDTSIGDFRVRKDVDRAPGGNPTIYQTTCRGCHAPMDAMSGAWAFFDRTNPLESTGIRPKYSQNATIFPAGYTTKDDSWLNLFTKNQNAALGWRGPLTGNGVAGLGKMLAESRAFSGCMAKRAFTKMCSREPNAAESSTVSVLQDKFEASNYNLRQLLEEAAIVPSCLGN